MSYTFSEENAKRIARVVEEIERTPKRIQPPVEDQPRRGFWAKITGTDGSGRYSWDAVSINASFDYTAEPFSGDATASAGFAIETGGSEIVATDSIVFLEHSGSQPCWQFTVVPNLVYATLDSQLNTGSFTTATYYIGTPTGLIQGSDTIVVYAPPLWSGDNLSAGSIVECTFSPAYGRWYVTGYRCTVTYT